MAIYYLKLKVGKSNSKSHYDYIMRENNFKNYKKQEDLIYKESDNLPSWSKENAGLYWNAVNKYEKGTHYREFETALPKELTDKQNIKLVQDFCKTIFGKNYTYSFAIHKNIGSLSGKENPHAHIMFSERIIDYNREKEPTKQEYFIQRRTDKETGQYKNGYVKDRKITGNKRKEWLKEKREQWADVQNKHLIKNNIVMDIPGASIYKQVSHKSLKEQNIEKLPQIHLGRAVINMQKKGIETNKYKIHQEIQEKNKKLQDIQKQIQYYEKMSEMLQLRENQIKEQKIKKQKLIKQYENKENKRQEILQEQLKYIDYGQEKNKQVQEYTRLKKEIQKYEQTKSPDKIFKNIKNIITGDTTEYKKYQENKKKCQQIYKQIDKYIQENQEQKILNILNEQDKQIEKIEDEQEQIQIKVKEIDKEIKGNEKEIYILEQEIQEKIKIDEKTTQYMPLQEELIYIVDQYINTEKEDIYTSMGKYIKEVRVKKNKDIDEGLER